MRSANSPNPAEVLIKGTAALLKVIALQTRKGLLATEGVPTLDPGQTPGSTQFGITIQPAWQRIVDEAYSQAESDPQVRDAVSLIGERLPKELRETKPLPLSLNSDDPAARVFCGFSEILCREGANPSNPERMVEDSFKPAEIAATALDAFCEAGSYQVVLTAPLSGVRLQGNDPVDIHDGTRIVPIGEEGQGEIWRRIGFDPQQGMGWMTTEPLAVAECAAVVELLSEYKPSEQNLNWAPSQETLEGVVEALRLLSPGNIHWIAAWPDFPAHDVFLKRFMLGGVSRPGPRPMSPPEPSAPPVDAKALRVVFDRLRETQNWRGADKHAFDLAMRRFAQTYGRWSFEDRLIDYWVAFESLFLPESDLELKYRAQMRIARFVGDTLEEREAIRKLLGNSYAVRSAIVHGSRAKKISADSVRSATVETAETLRVALRRWIDPHCDRSAEALDRSLLS